MDTTAPSVPPPAPLIDEKKPEDNKIADGAGPAVGAPKPVEVLSVPETPVNGTTPAGGTPKPELDVSEEVKEPPEEEPTVLTGIKEPEPTPVVSRADSIIEAPAANGESKMTELSNAVQSELVEEIDASVGAKRKLEDIDATNGDGPIEEKAEVNERAEKKAKVDEKAVTNGESPPKESKGKKGKRPGPTPGRAARKTRSQGPVEV